MLIILINKINNQCDKSEPIQKSNECQDIYCTDEEYKNEECIISNPIIKKQWLNNKIFFGENYVFVTDVIKMINNDIIFASNSVIYGEDEEHNIYSLHFFGFKSNGEKYFNGNFITKSSIEYTQFNSVGIKIDNNKYPLVCSEDYCFIFDLENSEIYIHELKLLFQSPTYFKYSIFFSNKYK